MIITDENMEGDTLARKGAAKEFQKLDFALA